MLFSFFNKVLVSGSLKFTATVLLSFRFILVKGSSFICCLEALVRSQYLMDIFLYF